MTLLIPSGAASGGSISQTSISVGDGTEALPSIAFTSDLDNGFYRIGANNFGASANGVKVLDISTTGLGVVGTVLLGNGTVALPAFAFTSDTDSGLYRVAANSIALGVAGAIVLGVTATGVAVTGTTLSGDGTVSLPGIGFSGDTDTGVYRIGANNLGVAAAGAKVLDVSATGLGVTGTTLSGDGTVSLPGLGFSADPDCGLYRIGTNNIGVAVNGAKVLDVSTAGLGVTGTVNKLTLTAPAAGATLTLADGSSLITTGAFATTFAATASATYTLAGVAGTQAQTTGANLFTADVYRTSAAVTKNANVTPATVTGLSATVVVGTYRFRAYLPSTVASGTGGIAYSVLLTTTVLSAMECTGTGYTASAVAVQHTTTATSGVAVFTQAAVVIQTLLEGTFVVSTGGTLAIQMCQNTSNASDTVALLGGYLELVRIA